MFRLIHTQNDWEGDMCLRRSNRLYALCGQDYHDNGSDRQTGNSMKTSNKSAADHHAAKRRWLNSHEEGYHKAMGNRQVQMIAIGGAIGTGLF